ncbi:GNAT family N-acetyltransferase [Terrabacter carboxydivorans]|uniref:GNAT family protein n=1 Tax=Terrabacter carboxydivorans TaxID=619730 RepID=A0ABP5Y8L9_9MICO
MGASAWPLHGIRLRTADLDLRVMTEADLPELWELLPDDVEMNPHATTYAGLDVPANRRAVLAQGYWRALGLWSPDDWALPFVVRRDGEVVGAQWLEGPDWRADHAVDSSSWLVPAARGRGLGKQMRAAVLALAFGPLRAEVAVSSAVLGNAGSLGVSRSLGYLDTHRSVLEHSGETLQHVRLTRAAWARAGGADLAGGTVVDGVAPALPLFGIEGAS